PLSLALGKKMKEAIHKHLPAELDRSSKSDTVFIISGVTFNLLVLFVNWVQAIGLGRSKGNIIFSVFLSSTPLLSRLQYLWRSSTVKRCAAVFMALSKSFIKILKWLSTCHKALVN
ncbi:MAG: hypothetical protein P8144_05540, partial [Gammaproteobacteria bacterium]